MSSFEYDPAKSIANRAKHGIDFEQAQAIWEDEARLVYASSSQGEKRWVAVGLAGRKLWAAAYTVREESVRIISVRRARKEEVARYVEWQDD